MKILSRLKFLILISLNIFMLDTYAGSSESSPTIGEIEFERSCMVCHGKNGKGNGIMSDSLTTKPSDLTVLTKNNNGHFPFTDVYRIIDGSSRVGIHGTREMPTWGDRYREEAEQYNEISKKYHEITDQPEIDEYLYSRGLILDLLVYIMSIQEQ